MTIQDTVRKVISRQFEGTVEAEATDDGGQVRVTLSAGGEVAAIEALDITATVSSAEGLAEAVIEAGNRAETVRVMTELAHAGALEGREDEPPTTLAPLPGPKAGPLVVRTPDEQADHLARYINAGGLDHLQAPGLRWSTASNGYLSLARNDRGQIAAVQADQEWLHAVTIDRLNNAFREALQS